MGDCYTPEQISDFVASDNNRIVGEIIMASARYSPYIDVLPSGTIDNNMGTDYRSVIQEPTKTASSLTIPEFTPQSQTCRNLGGIDKTGQREYSFLISTLRNRSEEVCVKQAKSAFKRAYLTTADSLKKAIVKVKNADIRGQLFSLSGLKASVIDGRSVESCLNGTIGAISTPFLSTTPDAFVTFKWIKRLANIMADDFMVEPFESPNGEMFRWVGSRDSVDRFRDELDIRADLRAMITGRYQLGDKSINSFSWDGPYQNIGFAVDPQPLRAEIGGGGPAVPGTTLELVEPEIEVPVANGVGARPNPAWLTARWEIGMLIGGNSFKRVVNPYYKGEGIMDFPHQLAIDTLAFKSVVDNDCNWFGDMGRFGYELTRGYEPMQTHAVVFVLYRRCPGELNTDACTPSGAML